MVKLVLLAVVLLKVTEAIDCTTAIVLFTGEGGGKLKIARLCLPALF